MTVETGSRVAGPYAGNDSATSFAFTFKAFVTTDVRVVFTDADDLESDKVLDVDYGIVLNANQNDNPGGTVTYPLSGSPLATGTKLTLVGDRPYQQQTDLTNLGAFHPEVVESMGDDLEMQIQQLRDEVDRAVKTDVSSDLTPDELIQSIEDAAAAAAASAAEAEAFVAGIGFSVGQYFKQRFVAGVGFTAGSTTALTLTTTPVAAGESSLLVFFDGVYQEDGTWSYASPTITFDAAIPLGVGVVQAIWSTPLALPTVAAGSVTTASLEDGAVTTPKIATSAVTEPKIAANAVTTAKILDGAITNTKLDDSAVHSQPQKTDPDTADELLIYDSDTAALARLTLEDMLKVIVDLPQEATPVTSADFLLMYSAADAVAKKILMNAVGGGGGAVNSQVFTSSSTWNKPASGTLALIRAWGGGGGAGGNNLGAGGGGYSERLILLSALGATETVTIGAGGAGSAATGTIGGNTTFGAWLTAYGGGPSSASVTGSGGGALGAGSTSTSVGGKLGGGASGVNSGTPTTMWGGGAGAGLVGSDAFLGGAGGGGTSGSAGGASKAGGNGGAGGGGGGGVAGTAPGGGGGSADSGAVGGAGGAGRVEVYVW